jgi:DNA adenine methylase
MLKAVNVSTVPQRSPFRYPGGKTWLIPQIRDWLNEKGGSNISLIEPFGGSAIVSLTAVMEQLVNNSLIIELDQDIAAVWETMLGENGRYFAEKVRDFIFTEETVSSVLYSRPMDLAEHAFQTHLKNRVARNGILAPGAGILKNGESSHGLASRWYPDTLYTRILNIIEFKNFITFQQRDGIIYLKNCAKQRNFVYFIDPPYNGVGHRLYRHGQINNPQLFRIVSSLEGDFLMTYTKTTEIEELATKYGFSTEPIQIGDNVELLIGRDLSWISEAPHHKLNNREQETLSPFP